MLEIIWGSKHFTLSYLTEISSLQKKFQALDLRSIFFSKAGTLLDISCTSYLEDSHNIFSILEEPLKLLLLEGSDDEGLSQDIFSNDKK